MTTIPFFMPALVYKVMSLFLPLCSHSPCFIIFARLGKVLKWSGLSINYHDVKETFFWVCSKGNSTLTDLFCSTQIFKIWSITVNLPFHKIWEQLQSPRGSCGFRQSAGPTLPPVSVTSAPGLWTSKTKTKNLIQRLAESRVVLRASEARPLYLLLKIDSATPYH